MTVIAFDGKTLAADRLMVSGYTKNSTIKIRRHGRELLGITGNLSVGMEMLNWYEGGANPEKYPTTNRNPNEGASLIVVKGACEVFKYESSPYPFRCEGEFFAFGSGDEAALVALACGLDARAAVEMACRFNTSCGNGIDTLTLG